MPIALAKGSTHILFLDSDGVLSGNSVLTGSSIGSGNAIAVGGDATSSGHNRGGKTTAVDGSWQQEREFDTDLAAGGYGIGISFDLGRYAFLGGSHSRVRTESFEDALDGVEGRLDYRTMGVDLGVIWPWTERLGATLTGGYAVSTTNGRDGFRNDRPERVDGATGSLSLWYQPSSRLAFTLGGGYAHLGGVPGWDTSAGISLRLWHELWFDAGYWRGADLEGWSGGLRAYLPEA